MRRMQHGGSEKRVVRVAAPIREDAAMVMTLGDIARALKVSESSARRSADRGCFGRAVVIGGLRRWPSSNIDRFLRGEDLRAESGVVAAGVAPESAMPAGEMVGAV